LGFQSLAICFKGFSFASLFGFLFFFLLIFLFFSVLDFLLQLLSLFVFLGSVELLVANYVWVLP